MSKATELVAGKTYRFSQYTGYGSTQNRAAYGTFLRIEKVEVSKKTTWRRETRTVTYAVFNPIGLVGDRAERLTSDAKERVTDADGLARREGRCFDTQVFDPDTHNEQAKKWEDRQLNEHRQALTEAEKLVDLARWVHTNVRDIGHVISDTDAETIELLADDYRYRREERNFVRDIGKALHVAGATDSPTAAPTVSVDV